MRNYHIATVRDNGAVLHIQAIGNRHTLCGRIALFSLATLAPADQAKRIGAGRMCKSCAKVTIPRDTSRPVDRSLSEPTDTWSVTNRAGAEIAVVDGETMVEARDAARKMPAVRIVSPREGGFSLRRFTVRELCAVNAVDALEESTWSTTTLHTVLLKDFGVRAEGRRVICAALAARGVTPEGVRVLNG